MTRTALWCPVPQSDPHAAFPGLCLLPGGMLMAAWRESTRHTGGTPSRIALATSADGMRTWLPWEPLGGIEDERDPSLACSRAGGTVWLSTFLYNTGSPVLQVRDFLPDYGWSDAVTVGPGATTAPVVELADGGLLLPSYGRARPGDTWDSCQLWRCDPAGTWTGPTMLADGQVALRHLQEPYVIGLRSGALLAAFRYGAAASIGLSASWDGGATWSAPVAKFAGTGRPMLAELATGPTVCVYRQPATRGAVYRESVDRGGMWGPEKLLATAPGQMSYAAAVELRPGLVAGLVGLESGDTVSRLQSWYLDDVAG